MPCIEISRRIIGITNHNGSGTVVDQFLKLLNLRQRETLINGCRNRFNLRAGTDGESHIISISGLGYDDFIPRIQTTHKRKQHSFTTT